MNDRDPTEEFRRIAVPHLDRVYASAVVLARSPDLAEDLTQETFLRALRFFHQFERGTNCRAWLLTILLNVYRNRYRVVRREGVTADFDDPLVEAEVHEHLAPPDDPERRVLSGTLHEEVEEALRELSDEFRTVILLVDLQDLTYQEAASVLDCPVGTIRSRLSRARSLLAARLREFARNNGYLRTAR